MNPLCVAQMHFIHKNVRPWVRWAKERRLRYRIEETNTLSIQVCGKTHFDNNTATSHLSHPIPVVSLNLSNQITRDWLERVTHLLLLFST